MPSFVLPFRELVRLLSLGAFSPSQIVPCLVIASNVLASGLATRNSSSASPRRDCSSLFPRAFSSLRGHGLGSFFSYPSDPELTHVNQPSTLHYLYASLKSVRWGGRSDQLPGHLNVPSEELEAFRGNAKHAPHSIQSLASAYLPFSDLTTTTRNTRHTSHVGI